MLETTNSYLKALASRPEYAPRVIDKFMKMFEEGETINEETVRWALKAAATSAALTSAVEIVKVS